MKSSRTKALRLAALLSSVCGGVFTFSGAALAQDEPAATEGSGMLEEVVVTARRREERLQDVPVAVAAFTPEKLQEAQVTTARQLVGMAPSLNISSGNQRDFQRFTIRGQGATVGAGESVTVYIAEAPASQYVAGGPGLYFDLENLQVLNGPQGTLFGRNTIGGAVLFTPRRPTDANEGFIQVGYGNYNNREIAGVLNLAPNPDLLRFRFSADLRRRDGFTTVATDGSKLDSINYQAYRASVLFTPTDWLSNYFMASYTISDTSGTGIILEAVNPTGSAARAFGLANVNAVLAQQERLGKRITLGNAPHWWFTKTFMAVNNTTVELPYNLTFKNIASFSRVRASGGFDNDGTPFPLTHWVRTPYSGQASGVGESRNEYLTNETQLQGAWYEDRLNWVLGGFYQNSYPYGFQEIRLIGGGVTIPNQSHLNTTSSALFGQATLDFGLLSPALDKLKFTAGYRYSWDTRHYTAVGWTDAGARPCSAVAGAFYPNCLVRLDRKFKAGTYNFALDYKITPNVLAYGTVRSGYKSGGFNVNANVLVPPVFLPEKVTDYELGVKADFNLAGMPFRTNVAIFKDKYKDIQRSVFRENPNAPGSILTWLDNAAAATIKGLEAQVTVRPTDDLNVDLTYSYLDGEYDDYPNYLDARTNTFVNLKGVDLPYTPRHKWGVTVRYNVPVDPSWGDLSVYAAANYQGKYLTNDQPQPVVYEIGDYTLVNLGVNWRNVGESPVDFEFFITNLTNELEIAAGQVFYYGGGTAAASYIEPRMFGVRLRYAFGQ